MLRLFHIFNVSQIDGLSLLIENKEPLTEHERDAKAEAFIKATNADIRHGGDRAYYNQVYDHVQLPELRASVGADQYISVAFHELGIGQATARGSTGSLSRGQVPKNMRSGSLSRSSLPRICAPDEGGAQARGIPLALPEGAEGRRYGVLPRGSRRPASN
jgi:antirestriction protein ArdC